jgi:hypothetical protein
MTLFFQFFTTYVNKKRKNFSILEVFFKKIKHYLYGLGYKRKDK